MIGKSILVYDIETDSLNVDKAKLKFFGAYSYLDDKYYSFDYTKNCQIMDLIKRHKIVVGFNNKNYDDIITNNFLKREVMKYNSVDLYEQFSPKGKNKLANMGIKLNSFSLNNIFQEIFSNEESKGDINYNIFKKNKWNNNELIEIEKYLKQDVVMTKKLIDWYYNQFKPLEDFLNKDDVEKMVLLKSSLSVIGYKCICNLAGLEEKYAQNKPTELKTFAGGHHINPRWNKVKGDIICVDFASAYPHALIQGNLYTQSKSKGWVGNNYYNIKGKYKTDKLGKIESALNSILSKRLKEKYGGDKIKAQAYKIVINSIYGLTGNYIFESLYNPITASDCTSIVRTWMKKMAKVLEENGFIALYGFTDSVDVKIPYGSSKEELMYLVNKTIGEFKENLPFPQETFKMGIDEEMKFMSFFAKNCYLWVDKNNNVKYTSTLFNKNTSKLIQNIIDNYIKPKIIKEFDVNFTQDEIITIVVNKLKKDISLAGKKWKVSNISEYKSNTSIQYQISDKYGEGEILLIPNNKYGVGKSKKYCSIDEFKKNKLNISDIDMNGLISTLKPLIKIKGEVFKNE